MAIVELYINDLPRRLTHLLNSVSDHATLKERDLTLLLAIASQGILVPWERLTTSKRNIYTTPSYYQAVKTLKELQNQSFLKCPLWAAAPKSWRIRSQIGKDLTHFTDKAMYGLRCRQVLYQLSNALAHGNVALSPLPYTVDIIFYHYSYTTALAVSMQDFCIFLRKWFAFIESLSLE